MLYSDEIIYKFKYIFFNTDGYYDDEKIYIRQRRTKSANKIKNGSNNKKFFKSKKNKGCKSLYFEMDLRNQEKYENNNANYYDYSDSSSFSCPSENLEPIIDKELDYVLSKIDDYFIDQIAKVNKKNRKYKFRTGSKNKKSKFRKNKKSKFRKNKKFKLNKESRFDKNKSNKSLYYEMSLFSQL